MPASFQPDAAGRIAAFAHLRQKLDARSHGPRRGTETGLATGIAGLDDALGGGLPRGALTELMFTAPSSGGQLVLLHLLHAARRAHRFIALVDGADGFDPQTIEPASLLRHLLWVRCTSASAALQAADLIARDSNFGLLALDLRGCNARELRRTPATTWYRLQRVVEPTDTVFAVLTQRRLVPAAQARLTFDRPLPIAALIMEQDDLAEQLTPAVDRLRTATEWDAAEMEGDTSPALSPTPALTLTLSLSLSPTPTLSPAPAPAPWIEAVG